MNGPGTQGQRGIGAWPTPPVILGGQAADTTVALDGSELPIALDSGAWLG